MEAEALNARAELAGRGLALIDVDAVAEPQLALAGLRAGGDASLDRRRVEFGEQGRKLCAGVQYSLSHDRPIRLQYLLAP